MQDNFPINLLTIFFSQGSWKNKILKAVDLLLGSIVIRFLIPQKQRADAARTLKTILIIRPGGMGDALFLLPFLRVLRRQYPDIEIDVLCEKRNSEVFTSQNALCRAIYSYDNIPSLLGMLGKRYDAVVDTEQWHYLSGLVAYFVTSPFKVGFATRFLRARLFNKKIPYLKNDYELNNFSKLFEPLLEGKAEIKTLRDVFLVSDELLRWAQKEIPEKSVCLALGASIPARRINSEQIILLARFLIEQGFHVVLLGGSDALQQGWITSTQISDVRILNFINKVSLAQCAALIKRSQFFVGPDSGIIHLACAVGKNTIALFGPGNREKWAPKESNHCIVTKNVACSPCTRFGYTLPTCRGSYQCMQTITLADLIPILNQMIKR